MEDDSHGDPPQRPESLLPYDLWTEEAMRKVVALALKHVADNGFPGEHHFYISFRTDARGVVIPQRLLAQYPHEITIVLQHQFWDLKIDDTGHEFSVGLSFGGVPATLIVPFRAVTGFADPHVQFNLRFSPPAELPANDAEAEAEPAESAESPPEASAEPQVVSLDAFRKRPPNKDN
jgi:hypothetical protein